MQGVAHASALPTQSHSRRRGVCRRDVMRRQFFPAAIAQDTATAQPETPNQADSTTLVVGDRLRISVFERVEQDDDKWAARKRVGRPDQSFYPRQDLTGEFVVQPDGTLPVPLLGNVPAEGQTGAMVAEAIATAFQAMVARPARVTQALVERPAVSIVGPVRQPGMFKYTDGMSILHVLALAGGLRRTDDNWTRVEYAKEQAKLPAAKERFQRLHIEAQLLRAERDGLGDAESLQGLANFSPALIAEVGAGRRHIRQAYLERKAALEAGMEAAKEALVLSRERLEASDAAVEQREERVRALKLLADRNAIGRPVFLEASVQLSDARERKLAAAGLVTEAKLRVASAQIDQSRFDLETKMEIDRLLAQRLQESADAAAALNSSEAVVTLLAPEIEPDSAALASLDFEIVRRSGTYWRTISATTATIVKPGDLIRIDVNRGRLTAANQ